MNDFILISMVLATIVYIVQPYWRRQAATGSGPGRNGQLLDLVEKRDNLLAQIKELEFDLQVGKVSAEDFAEINARYRSEAINIFRRIDSMKGNRRPAQKLEKELQRLRAQRKAGMKFCQQCGGAVAKQDRFCSSCGRQL